METDNSALFLYAEMEAHRSGLGRKRKREELNGHDMKECSRKRPRRTLVSIGKVADDIISCACDGLLLRVSLGPD